MRRSFQSISKALTTSTKQPKDAGVKRFIFGSSGATQMGYEREEPVLSMVEARYDDIPDPPGRVYVDSPARPDRMYGVAKVAGEVMGRYYSETHGMSVICIKLGRVTAENKPDDPRSASVYLSHHDAAQIVWRCVEAPADVRYDIVYGVSDNKTRGSETWNTRPTLSATCRRTERSGNK